MFQGLKPLAESSSPFGTTTYFAVRDKVRTNCEPRIEEFNILGDAKSTARLKTGAKSTPPFLSHSLPMSMELKVMTGTRGCFLVRNPLKFACTGENGSSKARKSMLRRDDAPKEKIEKTRFI